MIKLKSLLVNIFFSWGRRVFIYLVQDDLTMVRLTSEALRSNMRIFPGSVHIVLPVYGIYIFNPLESRYPKKLKKAQLFLSYLKQELSLKQKLREQLSLFLTPCEVSECTMPSAFYWLLCLFVSPILENTNQLRQIFKTKKYKHRIREHKTDFSREIIDTFIRFKPSPSFIENDGFVNNIKRRAMALCLFYRILFYHKSTCLYCSYTSYIHNGIPAKLVYKNKQTLITLGSSRCLYRLHDTSKSNPLISAHPDHSQFNTKDAQTDVLSNAEVEEARKILINRLDQKYDSSMSYMSNTPSSDVALKRFTGECQIQTSSVILMLHAFNDSVHVYRWFLFNDFLEWAIETIKHCISNSENIYIKPHPNTDEISLSAIQYLKSTFEDHPNVRWLSPELKNSFIFNAKPKLIITGYGSVAIESAFCGVPVLVAGDYPGENLNIAMSPKNKYDYFKYLANPVQNDPITSQSNAIYTMAFLKHFEGKPQLMSLLGKTRSQLKDSELLSSQLVNHYLQDAFTELAIKMSKLGLTY